MRKYKVKCQVVFTSLKVRSSSKWYFDNGFSRPITRDKFFFTSLEDYNDETITFGARVKGKGSISIPYCAKLYWVLYVDGLKANLLSISQICDKDHRVNFCQDLCEVVIKEGKIIIIGHRTINNCYAINPNSKTPLMCNKAKIDLTELWHRRLDHINYRDLMHLVNSKKVRGIYKLNSERKPIYGECIKGKETKKKC